MEGSFGFLLGGDPEDLMRGLREFAEKQAESVAEAQREQFATLTLNTAVALTAAALSQVKAEGGPDEQAIALRDAMQVLFPRQSRLFPLLGKGLCASRSGLRGPAGSRHRQRSAGRPQADRPPDLAALHRR